jgi:PadR family transcriptional regulator, regulatory protein PadR
MTDMREPTFLVLSALAGGRKHGYAIISDADAASDGRVKLKAGTLYTALDRLSREGLVAPAGDEVVDGRLRRYYELTEPGAEALAVEAKRQQTNASRALRQLSTRTAAAQ